MIACYLRIQNIWRVWDRDRWIFCRYPLGNVKRFTWIWKAEFLLLGDRSRLTDTDTGTCNVPNLAGKRILFIHPESGDVDDYS